jgi:hypothetical protein
MPHDGKHQQKAVNNERFAERLDKSDYTAELWGVISVFYSALHYVTSVLGHCGGHKERAVLIARHPILRYASSAYEHLEWMSKEARYRTNADPRWPRKPYHEAKIRLDAVKVQVSKVP